MESQVDEVKSKVDIASLIGEYVQLKKTGRNYKALCPFHKEKTPSFMVNSDRQIFKCFGCNEGGDAFAFLKRMEGMEFGEALRFLANRTGVRLKEYKASPEEEKKETLLKINVAATEAYHYLLTKHPIGKKAREYLRKRKINEASINSFKLGYASGQKNFLFQYLVKKGYSPQDLNMAGLTTVSQEGVTDRFRNRIIFPIFDSQDRPIAFSGRNLGNEEPKYLNSPETPTFHKSQALYGLNLAKTEIKKEKNAVLVEGNLDVISSHQVGVVNTVAPLGTALTSEQVSMLQRFAENLLFAFDTDLAGDAAAKRGIDIAENAGLNIRVVQLEESKDPDDLIRKNPALWKKAVKEAVPIYDYFIDSAIRKYGAAGAENKRKVANEVLMELASLEDEILKAHYLQALAFKLGVEETILRLALEKFQKNKGEKGSIQEILEKPLSEKGAFLIEKYLLALIIQSGEIPTIIDEKIFSDPNNQEIFKFIDQFKKKEGRIKVKALTKTLPDAILPTFDELLLLEIGEDTLEDSQKIEKEMISCAARLKELNLRARLKELSLAIKQAEAIKDNLRVRALSEQFRDLSKTLMSLESDKSQ